jgi:predicted Zn finger-like uncharacterized protein
MLIVCPSCATSYDVEPATLQPNGRRVRCVCCRAVWRAELSHAEKLMAAAEAIAPIREMADAIDALAMAAAAEPAVGFPVQQPDDADWTTRQAADGDNLTAPAGSSGVTPETAEVTAAAEETGPAVEVEAPPIAPIDLDQGQPPIEIAADQPAEQSAEPPEDIETYVARREKLNARRQPLRWPLSKLQSGVLALLIVDAILVGWRDEIVRILPQTASFYSMMGLSVNLRGLAFDGITTSTEQHEGVPIFVVEGNIVNESRKIADVPRLKFAVRNPAGQEIYSWTAVSPRTTLPPGETVSFRSRLASPPPEGRDVLVRFVTGYDIIAGIH